MARGKFITVEGIEGVGKTSNIAFIVERLGAAGHDVLATREPGGTPLAESIRDVLLEPGDEELPDAAELLLMFAARAVHIENRIRPAVEAGRWVVCDRYTDATLAYQGAGRGMSYRRIRTLANWVHADLWPDMTILLDAPVPVALERARNDKPHRDRFEREDDMFFERIRAAYLELAAAEPARFRVVDASADVDGVREQIALALDRFVAVNGIETHA